MGTKPFVIEKYSIPDCTSGKYARKIRVKKTNKPIFAVVIVGKTIATAQVGKRGNSFKIVGTTRSFQETNIMSRWIFQKCYNQTSFVFFIIIVTVQSKYKRHSRRRVLGRNCLSDSV